MKCPICNVWTSVLETRNKHTVTVRRRKCANEHIFITEERVVPLEKHGRSIKIKETDHGNF